jgi:glucokinase
MILAADIGGTTARFRLAEWRGARTVIVRDAVYRVADHTSFDDALARFLQESGHDAVRAGGIEAACMAVAGPVAGKQARLTNGSWAFDAEAISRRVGIERVTLVNDFEASAAGVDGLEPESIHTLQAGEFVGSAPRLIIGAGTGLGVAYVIRCDGGRRVVPGEGGHIGFAPRNEEQIALWRFLHDQLERVSVEHIVSGPGLVRLYGFACRAPGNVLAVLPPDVAVEGAAAVVRRAVAEQEPAACRAVDLFIECYGAVAGDHALSILARGGVYVTGGIAPKLLARMSSGGFLAAFRNKGGHAGLMAQFPVHVVVDEALGLSGAASIALRAAARKHECG